MSIYCCSMLLSKIYLLWFVHSARNYKITHCFSHLSLVAVRKQSSPLTNWWNCWKKKEQMPFHTLKYSPQFVIWKIKLSQKPVRSFLNVRQGQLLLPIQTTPIPYFTKIPSARQSWKCSWESHWSHISEIATKLNTCIKQRLDGFVSNLLFRAVSIFLDTQAYEISDMEDIYTSAGVIQDHFENLLVANGCETSKIRTEFEILYKHIKMFLEKKSPDKVWPHMFSQQKEIVISNLLHIAEIAISIPTSDAETERIFSFLCKIFAKERQSCKNDGLNDILHLCTDENFDCSHYDLTTHLFLTEHPNGEVKNTLVMLMATNTQRNSNQL